MSDIAQADIADLHTHTLSPASPKPIHLPSPSNIPILDNPKMEAELDMAGKDQNSVIEGQVQAGQGIDMTLKDYMSLPGIYETPATNQVHETVGLPNVNQSYPSSTTADATYTTQTSSDVNFPAAQSQAGAVAFPTSSILPEVAFPNEQDTPMDDYPITESETTNANLEAASQSHASLEGTGGINFQALLDNLSSNTAQTLPTKRDPTIEPDTSSASVDALSAAQFTETAPALVHPAGVSLPPRPPPQHEQLVGSVIPKTDDEITPDVPTNSYAQSMATAFLSSNFPSQAVPGGGLPTLAPNGMPPPPTATFQSLTSAPIQNLQEQTTAQTHAQSGQLRPDSSQNQQDGDGDVVWDPSLQGAYESFVEEEKGHVDAGQWDRFPAGSRLFVGESLEAEDQSSPLTDSGNR